MGVYLRLFVVAAIPVVATILIVYLNKKELNKQRYEKKTVNMIAIGLLYGLFSILGSVFGVEINGTMANVRDIAPILAALGVDWRCGIVAGLVGGAFRFISPDAGEYTRIACTLATILSGLIAAFLRKVIFEDKHPTWYSAILTGAVCETLHMLMILAMHRTDPAGAFTVVDSIAFPMIAITAFSVGLCFFIITILRKEKLFYDKKKSSITTIMQAWMCLITVFAFLLVSLFEGDMQARMEKQTAANLLSTVISDVKSDIFNKMDQTILDKAKLIAGQLETSIREDDEVRSTVDKAEDAAVEIPDENDAANSQYLDAMSTIFDVDMINIINEEGMVVASSEFMLVNYDMKSSRQSRNFHIHMLGVSQYVEGFIPMFPNGNVWEKCAAAWFENGKYYVQISMNPERVSEQLNKVMQDFTENRHVGSYGYVLICTSTGEIVSDQQGHMGVDLSDTELFKKIEWSPEDTLLKVKAFDKDMYAMYESTDLSYYIIGLIEIEKMSLSRNMNTWLIRFIVIIIFFVMYIFLYILTKRKVTSKLKMVNEGLAEITAGNLDTVIDVQSGREFVNLSEDVNETVAKLKSLIAQEAARIDRELETARAIQESALPTVEGPFVSDPTYEIYAVMHAAKEVGGDFYDF
ncbi:MAG: hypothetical protein HUJ73_00005, partial [Eubacterium sp.]|nr:hypothetical protein [Eubacterium sp.]